MPSKRRTPSVFVTNLPPNCSDAALTAHFSAVAPVKRAFIIRDPRTRLSRGFGYVQFAFEDDAVLAAEKLNGSYIGGIVGGAGAGGGPSCSAAALAASGAAGEQKPIRVQVSRDQEDKEEKAAEEKKKKEKLQQQLKDKKNGAASSSSSSSSAAPPAPAAPAAAAKQSKAAAAKPVQKPAAEESEAEDSDSSSSEESGEDEEKEEEARPPQRQQQQQQQRGKSDRFGSAGTGAGKPSFAPGSMPVGKLLSLPLGEKMKRLVVFGLPAPAAPSDDKDEGKGASSSSAAAPAAADEDDDSDNDKDEGDDGAVSSSNNKGGAEQLSKALWKRVRKLAGILPSNAGGMQTGVRLEGNQRLTGVLLTFDRKDRRDKAVPKLDGHALHGHRLSVRRWEEVLPANTAHGSARLIVRNLRFTATAGQIARAIQRNAAAAGGATATTALAITHVHMPAPKETHLAGNKKKAAEAMDHGEDEDEDDASSNSEHSEDSEEENDGDAKATKAGQSKKTKKRSGPRPVTNRGFAFVEFATRADATRGLAGMAGGKRVDKRVVAVDWVLSPEAQAAQAAAQAAGQSTAAEIGKAKDVEKGAADEDDKDDNASVSTATSEEEEKEEKGDGEDDDEAKEGKEDEEDDDENGDDDDIEDGDGDEQEEKEKDEAAAAAAAAAADAGPQYSAASVEVGSTVFVRNLPFDATENDLYSCMRAFGPLKYARMVIERETGRPKGTAFVQFHSKESADRALEAAAASDHLSSSSSSSSSSSLTPAQLSRLPAKERKRHAHQAAVAAALAEGGVKLLGRTLQMARAITKDEAAKLAPVAGAGGAGSSSSSVRYDKRHLYLQWEGHIRPDSELGKAMPPGDASKRESAAKEKKVKLASPLFFVSPTRLSVRNLAKGIDDQALYKLCLKAARIGLQRGLVGPAEGDPMLRLPLKPWPRPMPSDSAPSTTDDNSRAPLHPILRDGPFVKILAAKVMREGGPAAILLAKQRAKEERLAAAAAGGKGATEEDEPEEEEEEPADDDDDSDASSDDGEGPARNPDRRALMQKPKGKAAAGGGGGAGKVEQPMSKGYGFVTFQHHMHALACLRQLNNNPDYSKEFAAGGIAADKAHKPLDQRPRLIVEFSVEDWRQVKKQDKKKDEREHKKEERKAGAGAVAGAGAGSEGGSQLSGNKRKRPDSEGTTTSARPSQQQQQKGAKRPRRDESASSSSSSKPGAGAGARRPAAGGAGAAAAGFVTSGGARSAPSAASAAAAAGAGGRERGRAPTTGKAAWDSRIDKAAAEALMSAADGGAAGGASRKDRRASKKKAASEDADHDRLVAEYKAKLFG